MKSRGDFAFAMDGLYGKYSNAMVMGSSMSGYEPAAV